MLQGKNMLQKLSILKSDSVNHLNTFERIDFSAQNELFIVEVSQSVILKELS